MKRNVVSSSKFRKSVKRLKKRGTDLTPLDAIIDLLASRSLTADEIHEYRDHPLSGNHAGYRDIHIGGATSDWVLIYRIVGDSIELEDTTLELSDTGTHSDLFGSDELIFV